MPRLAVTVTEPQGQAAAVAGRQGTASKLQVTQAGREAAEPSSGGSYCVSDRRKGSRSSNAGWNCCKEALQEVAAVDAAGTWMLKGWWPSRSEMGWTDEMGSDGMSFCCLLLWAAPCRLRSFGRGGSRSLLPSERPTTSTVAFFEPPRQRLLIPSPMLLVRPQTSHEAQWNGVCECCCSGRSTERLLGLGQDCGEVTTNSGVAAAGLIG